MVNISLPGKRRSNLVFSLLCTYYATAQLPCTSNNIRGAWYESGAVHGSYVAPTVDLNPDSLRKVFRHNGVSTGGIWTFDGDGRYSYRHRFAADNRCGRYWVEEDDCVLMLSARRRDPIRIVHLDDSCMMLWHRNPKTAYVTVYWRQEMP